MYNVCIHINIVIASFVLGFKKALNILCFVYKYIIILFDIIGIPSGVRISAMMAVQIPHYS